MNFVHDRYVEILSDKVGIFDRTSLPAVGRLIGCPQDDNRNKARAGIGCLRMTTQQSKAADGWASAANDACALEKECLATESAAAKTVPESASESAVVTESE